MRFNVQIYNPEADGDPAAGKTMEYEVTDIAGSFEGNYYQDTVVPLLAANEGAIYAATASTERKNYLGRSCVANVLDKSGSLQSRNGATVLSKMKGNAAVSKFTPRAAKKLVTTTQNFGIGVLN
ncbi:hypothetical protein GQ600_7309 [Phytophthora cactorum]|nr:hypothetical protein GQ600_7309 [Phytophthora cactorum]